MGLDMFLTRKKYIGANYSHRNVNGNISIKIGEKQLPIDFDKVSYIEESVGYWRKANAIHNWLVQNVQDGVDDCKEHYVSIEKLQELLDICKEVKAKAKMRKGKVNIGEQLKEGNWVPITEEGKTIKNAKEIAEILPTTSGFFFGSTSYDEYYMNDIDYTIEMLEKILKEEKELNENGFYNDYYYCSSW